MSDEHDPAETTQLEPKEIEILREIVETYQASKLDLRYRRPRFKKPRVNSGVLLCEAVRERALEKAKLNPDATGGSLSGLIEVLLWRYIGSPSDVLEKPDIGESI